MKKIINIKDAPKALGPYSHAVANDGFLFVSGQIGVNPETNKLENGIESQTRTSLQNLDNILISAGFARDNVVKSTIFIVNMDDFSTVNKIYSEFFVENFAARSCVEVSKLPANALVEIEVIAVK